MGLKRFIWLPILGLVATLAAIVSAQAPAQALSHVYSSCYATRYEANNQVDYGASGVAIADVFDCDGSTQSQSGGQKVVVWDTDYYDPNNGAVTVILTNNNYPGAHWGDNNFHAVYIDLCKLGGGGCLFKKDVNDRPW